MIERKFIEEKMNELNMKNYLKKALSNAEYSHADIQRTPLGTRIVIYSSKPGMVVGRNGENIINIQNYLKKKFGLDKVRIEVKEIKNPFIDAQIMANKIAYQIETLGVARFKAIGHKTLYKIMESGARGTEIIIAGLVPGKRAKSWRFFAGYLPKCGDPSDTEVLEGRKNAEIKLGTIGITVRILPGDVRMPDEVRFRTELKTENQNPEEKKEVVAEEKQEEKKEKSSKEEMKPKKKKSDNKKEE
ncbi:MAG: 30S ribosomal protein S3 [Candidatus Nanoarchaeia archaeon]|nr:30S ribosomal protein S3 [Candidatus Nanoarchaeia archaeon]